VTKISHRSVIAGIELEAYSIRLPGYTIGHQLVAPRRGTSEKGERFTRDSTIGTEYNSRPFATIREGYFLLRSGLRKYGSRRYRTRKNSASGHELLLVGGWTDRFAGAHIHLSPVDRELTKASAKKLAWHIHDHIPFLIAMGANSPVWANQITDVASNRIVRASRKYFRPIPRGELYQRMYDEMLFSRARKTKPGTLELRVLDSNPPEFVLAATCMLKAMTLHWLAGGATTNRIPAVDYTRARQNAAEMGVRAKLCWNGKWVTVPRYLDLFIWAHRHILDEMDIPEEIWSAIRLIKRRINGSTLVGKASRLACEQHPRTWQRHFAERYVEGLNELLSGNTLVDFAEKLRVELPDLDSVWLGRRNLELV
jgi:hypothetical protein